MATLEELPGEESGEFRLDRRVALAATFGGGNSTFTLPYELATDGSEGVVQVVTADGTIYTPTRPTTTTAVVTGVDLSAAECTVGIRFDMTVTLSTIYWRQADHTGQAKPDPRKTLQLQRLLVSYEDSKQFDVVVQGQERSAATYALALAAARSGLHSVPVLSNNERVTITISSAYATPCWISGAKWEGVHKTRSGLR
jgi:hypothetical protein